MKTKILSILLAVMMIASVFALTACDMSDMEDLIGSLSQPGEKGEQGEQGPIGPQGPQGIPGEDGEDGKDGTDGLGIEKVELNANGNLVITFTDGTTQTVEMPKDQHEHTFGEWRNHNTLSSCEDQLYYHICSGCSDIEWRAGSYEDHDWNVVTTEPTCQAGGYDTKTCESCGKVDVCNETPIADHDYNEEYVTDNSFHWNACKNCNATTNKAEHTLGDDGFCTVCSAQIGATEGIVYSISADNTYAEVIAYNGTATKIKIADTYMGLPVKVIYDEAFRQNGSITSVIIPDSVTSIGKGSFMYCSSLTSITIPDSVTSIGKYAFYHCYSLASVNIGNSVTSIGEEAFQFCYSLTSVTIPDSVTSIGYYAFYNCSSLASITIPDSVTYIGNDVFSNCNSALYTEYEYGKYVRSGDNPYAVLIEITNKNFGTYTMHEDTKLIAGGAFSGCSRLTSITIPDSVTSIGNSAFPGCSSLSSIIIPDSVTSISSYAFYNCDNLADIYYTGSEEEWTKISIGSNNTCLTNATIHYNYISKNNL